MKKSKSTIRLASFLFIINNLRLYKILELCTVMSAKKLRENRIKYKYNMMNESRISFDAMPEMLAAIAQKLESIESKVDNLTIPSNKEEKDEWFNLKGLCDYLPSHPAEQTVYGWTSTHFIPFHKKGKSIAFRKSEIDQWLQQSHRKSKSDLMLEASQFVNKKKIK